MQSFLLYAIGLLSDFESRNNSFWARTPVSRDEYFEKEGRKASVDLKRCLVKVGQLSFYSICDATFYCLTSSSCFYSFFSTAIVRTKQYIYIYIYIYIY